MGLASNPTDLIHVSRKHGVPCSAHSPLSQRIIPFMFWELRTLKGDELRIAPTDNWLVTWRDPLVEGSGNLKGGQRLVPSGARALIIRHCLFDKRRDRDLAIGFLLTSILYCKIRTRTRYYYKLQGAGRALLVIFLQKNILSQSKDHDISGQTRGADPGSVSKFSRFVHHEWN